MYSIGDYVIHKRDGVCKIINIASLKMSSSECDGIYYYLRPQKYEGMIYVPINCETGLRPLISRCEAQNLLSSIPTLDAPVAHTRDKKALQEHYDALLRPNTCSALAQTVKSIYSKHVTSSGALGHLPTMEEQILKRSEQALCEELAIALDTSEENVKARIESSCAGAQASAGNA